MMVRAVLMCAGDYTPMQLPPASSREGEDGGWFFVAVDGGLPRLLAQGIEPDLVLGDFDSLDKKWSPFLEDLERDHPERVLRLPCEKDDTDTIYAARMCLERGIRELLFYGALGGRLDHTFANVQTLAWLKKQGARGWLVGERVLAAVLSGETLLLPEGFEGTFSIFALDAAVTGVTLKGMKYPLDGAVLENTFPLGVSNEVCRDRRASVTVGAGTALMILQADPAMPPQIPLPEGKTL